MQAEITAQGKLIVTAETGTEFFALSVWAKDPQWQITGIDEASPIVGPAFISTGYQEPNTTLHFTGAGVDTPEPQPDTEPVLTEGGRPTRDQIKKMLKGFGVEFADNARTTTLEKLLETTLANKEAAEESTEEKAQEVAEEVGSQNPIQEVPPVEEKAAEPVEEKAPAETCETVKEKMNTYVNTFNRVNPTAAVGPMDRLKRIMTDSFGGRRLMALKDIELEALGKIIVAKIEELKGA